MTTKKIMELTEAYEPITPYSLGHAASIQRGRRSRPPKLKKMKDFGDGLLTPGALGPGGGLTWEQARVTPEDLDRFLRVRKKVI